MLMVMHDCKCERDMKLEASNLVTSSLESIHRMYVSHNHLTTILLQSDNYLLIRCLMYVFKTHRPSSYPTEHQRGAESTHAVPAVLNSKKRHCSTPGCSGAGHKNTKPWCEGHATRAGCICKVFELPQRPIKNLKYHIALIKPSVCVCVCRCVCSLVILKNASFRFL